MAETIEQEIIEMLLQHRYFYGHLLQQFRRHNVTKDDSMGKIITTLAVAINDELQPNLYINTNFYNSGDYVSDGQKPHTWGLTKEEKLAILEHEILHIINKHLFRVDNRNHYVWNIASDLAINQYIKGLPSGGFCTDCNIFVRKTKTGAFRTICPLCGCTLDKEKNCFNPLMIDDFKINGKKVQLNRNEATEIYYEKIDKEIPKQMSALGSMITNQKEGNAKDGIGNGGSANGGKDSSDGSSSSGVTGAGDSVKVGNSKIPLPMDNHEVWASGSDNREMAHEKIKSMVQNAVSKANERSQGYMPGWLQGIINECLDHKTLTWKSELRRFYGFREFSCFVSTRKRLNRRFPVLFPVGKK